MGEGVSNNGLSNEGLSNSPLSHFLKRGLSNKGLSSRGGYLPDFTVVSVRTHSEYMIRLVRRTCAALSIDRLHLLH